MLAHELKPKHALVGGMVSEKWDGIRVLSEPVTRGMLKSEVPWANTDKDSRFLIAPRSTGLWTRYANVIQAPDWFLDKLPNMLLDGEFITGRDDRQNLMSIVKALEPGPGWEDVQYLVFDSPPPEVIFADGEITGTNYNKVFDGFYDWFMENGGADIPWMTTKESIFRSVYTRLRQELFDNDIITVLKQLDLPLGNHRARVTLDIYMKAFIDKKGEGVIIREPDSRWIPERSHKMIKWKGIDDAEATVTGYTTGRETTLGSKLLGFMGALITNFNGKRLELSGFTNEERQLGFADGHKYQHETPEEWATEHPGEELPECFEASAFPRGTTITLRYRGFSNEGIPQEARYFRKRG